MTRSRAALAAACAAALALGAAGCALGDREREGGGVELRITRDFGQRLLAEARVPEIRDGETVMRVLQSRREVETAFGGRFVQSIDGLEGSASGGRSDWFYWVNGREAEVGAAEFELAPGEVVHWDYRRWEAAMRIPAIVGAFPEPFRSGLDGERIPVRVECAEPAGAACGEVKRRLSDNGARASGGSIGSSAGPETLRVVVGAWSQIRRLRTPALLGEGPERSGVFARFSTGGLELLAADGDAARAAPPGTGLVAATARGEELPTWIVTGVDRAGVERAAAALDPGVLRDAFAVAATPAGNVDLPLEAGG